MESSGTRLPSISPKAIPSKRLRGLISEMIGESGLDQETFSQTNVLLRSIENPSMQFISIGLTRQDDGWVLSQAEMRPYVVGVQQTEPRSVN
jgi:hypothetical protein